MKIEVDFMLLAALFAASACAAHESACELTTADGRNIDCRQPRGRFGTTESRQIERSRRYIEENAGTVLGGELAAP